MSSAPRSATTDSSGRTGRSGPSGGAGRSGRTERTESTRLAVLAGLLRAAHIGPVLAVTTVVVLYAIELGRRPEGTFLVGTAVLSGQLGIGWQNDAVDHHRDRTVMRSSKPIVAGVVPHRVVWTASTVALLACIPLSLANGWRAALVHLAAVGLAIAYNLGLKATPLSALCYLGAFGALPVFVALGAAGSPFGPWWAPPAAGLLGVGAHFMNTVPDRAFDLQNGVLGLPQRLSPRTGGVATALVFVAAAGLMCLGGGLDAARVGAFAVGGVGGIAVAVSSARDPRRAFGYCLCLAIFDVAALLVLGHLARAVVRSGFGLG